MKYSKLSTLTSSRPNKVDMKVTCAIIAVMFFGQALAQLEMKKFTINNGGNDMSGNNFELKSTIGHVDASTPTSGGNYNLNGGFRQQNTDLIFKNKF